MVRTRTDITHASSGPSTPAPAGGGDAYTRASVDVASGVRELILAGTLAPGQRIRQEALAAQYGVSRVPVREALRQLESEGLVVQVPHSGARVSEISLDECLEIYRIREALEPAVLAQSVQHLSDEDHAVLRRSLDRLEAAESDWRTWLLEDRTFHLGSFAAAEMPTALALVERFYNQTQPFRRAYFGAMAPEEMHIVHLEHRLIFDAVERRDPVDAEALQRSHVRRTRLELMREPGLAESAVRPVEEPRGQHTRTRPREGRRRGAPRA